MKSLKLIITLFMVFMLLGCTSTQSDEVSEKVKINTAKGDVEVPVNPKRIVTFDYAVIDYLMATDIQIESLGAVVTNAPDYQTEYLKKAQEIGALKAPDLEKVMSLNPQVIFISGRTLDFYEELEKIAPVVYLTTDNHHYLESIKKNTLELGKIFNNVQQSEELNQQLDSLVQTIEPQKDKALILMYNEGVLSNFGKGSRFGFIFDVFGYEPLDPHVEVSTHGVEVSYEYLAQKKPDLIFIVNRNLIHGGNVDIKTFYENPLLKGLKTKYIELDPNTIYQAAGGILSIQKTLTEIKEAK